MCDLYDITLNYYHDQPVSNIIIVFCEHITQARVHTRTCVHTHAAVDIQVVDGSVAPNREGVIAPFRRFRWRSMAGRCFIQINTCVPDTVSPRFWVFFAYKKIARPN